MGSSGRITAGRGADGVHGVQYLLDEPRERQDPDSFHKKPALHKSLGKKQYGRELHAHYLTQPVATAPGLVNEILLGSSSVDQQFSSVGRYSSLVALCLDRVEPLYAKDGLVHVANPRQRHVMEQIEAVAPQLLELCSDPFFGLSSGQPGLFGLKHLIPGEAFGTLA